MAQDKIVLFNEGLGEQEFDLEHAKALVKKEHSLGMLNWVPTEKSKYKIVDGALIKGTGTTAN